MANKVRKILVSLIVGIMLITAIIPAAGTAEAASKKPAKVKIISVKVNKAKTKATIKWKKAKNAKKYQVYLKKGKNAYKKIKTLKKRKCSVKIKGNLDYKVKIRAINGKKKGKFSYFEVLKYRDPFADDEDPVAKTITSTINGKKISFGQGDKIDLQLADNFNRKLEQSNDVFDSTLDGTGNGVLFGKVNGLTTQIAFEDGKLCIYIAGSTQFLAHPGVTTYWTIDGTEPKIGQKNLIKTFDEELNKEAPNAGDIVYRGTWKSVAQGTKEANGGKNQDYFTGSYYGVEAALFFKASEFKAFWAKGYDKDGNLVCETYIPAEYYEMHKSDAWKWTYQSN